MANNPLTELAQPGDDLRPFVNAIITALRGNFFVRGDDGNLVPSGDANNALRRDIGAPTHPVETLYANALQVGGTRLDAANQQNSILGFLYRNTGNFSLTWNFAGKSAMELLLFGATGPRGADGPDGTGDLSDLVGGPGGTGGGDIEGPEFVRDVAQGQVINIQVGSPGTGEFSKTKVVFAGLESTHTFETRAGTAGARGGAPTAASSTRIDTGDTYCTGPHGDNGEYRCQTVYRTVNFPRANGEQGANGAGDFNANSLPGLALISVLG